MRVLARQAEIGDVAFLVQLPSDMLYQLFWEVYESHGRRRRGSIADTVSTTVVACLEI